MIRLSIEIHQQRLRQLEFTSAEFTATTILVAAREPGARLTLGYCSIRMRSERAANGCELCAGARESANGGHVRLDDKAR